jgi:hypothetical protein
LFCLSIGEFLSCPCFHTKLTRSTCLSREMRPSHLPCPLDSSIAITTSSPKPVDHDTRGVSWSLSSGHRPALATSGWPL